MGKFAAGLIALALLGAAAPATAAELRNSGKLLLTGGVSNIEGAGGGGLATWATITGYATQEGIGANVHATYVGVDDYSLRSAGAAVGLYDRVEFSIARQDFDTGDTGAKLGLGKDFTFKQTVVGAKVRLFGDVVYGSPVLPQVAVGAQYKHNNQGAIIDAVGGRNHEGLDFYAAATKVFLAQSLVVNGTVRLTKANQTGLLGFGGKDDDYSAQFEGSVGYLFTKKLVLGAEYRSKPDNLAFAKESDWFDVFAAYAFNKNISATVAYADLGSIATFKNQRGVYLSLQAGF
jgi:hypothetical protein